jgi:hypothetical protein
MLIDEFMPTYDFDEKHETIVRASAETVYTALNSFDFNQSFIIRRLFQLRGLASKNSCDAADGGITGRQHEFFEIYLAQRRGINRIFLGIRRVCRQFDSFYRAWNKHGVSRFCESDCADCCGDFSRCSRQSDCDLSVFGFVCAFFFEN